MSFEKIGRYKVIAELGRGGMATVFRASDPNFEREVAIKVLPKAFLHDPQFRARFEREAKLVATLEHSAIVPVYDFGEEEGQPYIVMRLMSGGSLEEKLIKGRLSLDEAAKIFDRLGAALNAAHGKGIIHRDLKPANILFDQYNNAYLSDFGIARLSEGNQTLTGENIIGTPAYMSPEQIQGDKGLDGRSDIYSMGIIFFQMLSGNAPYRSTTPAKVMMMHILDPVPNLLQVRPNLSQEVENWLEKLLSKDPDDRFATADEMVEVLQAALSDKTNATLQIKKAGKTVISARDQFQTVIEQPMPAAHETFPQAPAPVKKRSRTAFAIGGGAVVLVVIVAIASVIFSGLRGEGLLASVFASPKNSTPTTIAAAEITHTPQVESVNLPTATREAALPPATDVPAIDTLPTNTIEPVATVVPEILTIGGAEKIAFLKDNEIWIMNVDGSDLRPLTDNGAEKHNLAYASEGLITFISGKCVWSADVESGQLDNIACFDTSFLLESFEISPDGTQAAISLNRELYIINYDKELLQQARYLSELRAMNTCESFGPLQYTTGSIVPTTLIHWSNDGNRLAVMVIGSAGGIQSDIIRILEIGNCIPPVRRLDEIPSARFSVVNYNKSPYIQTFGHDGDNLYALTSYTRSDGYGYLYLYNAETHMADSKVNVVGEDCCYRDPQFSPDGHYMVFAYQAFEIGALTELYYVPYGAIGTGARFDPLPLPEGFFSDAKVKPQPILIPAVNHN